MKKNKKFIVAVDGSTGTGKSVMSKLIAQNYDLSYIETGAIYRAVALLVKERAICLENKDTLEDICSNLNLNFNFENGVNKVILDSRDITENIRTPEISMLASNISSIPIVRENLLGMQQNLALKTNKIGSVLDGRDIGTVVFPDANIKFYLTANIETAAKRRFKDLIDAEINVSIEEVINSIKLRDEKDISRTIAPLSKAEDAITIETDDLTIEEVYKIIKNHIDGII